MNNAVLIFKAYIMSRIQYGLVFSLNVSKKLADRLQKLQSRSMQVCFLADGYTSNYESHVRTKVFPVVVRTKLELLMLMFIRVRNVVSNHTMMGRQTRQSGAPVLQYFFLKNFVFQPVTRALGSGWSCQQLSGILKTQCYSNQKFMSELIVNL